MNKPYKTFSCQIHFSLSFDKVMVKILIIGAGAAGIAAANRLSENRFTNFTILEAENRVGGRIYSVKFGNAFVDLGAEFCHGENIIYDLVRKYNLLKPTEMIFPQLCHSSKELVRQDIADELFKAFYTIYMAPKQENQSFGSYFDQKYREIVTAHFQDKSHCKGLALESFDLFKKWVTSYEGSFSWYTPTIVSDYQICKGNHLMTWQGNGCGSLLKVLTKKYPAIEDKIILNKEVTDIIWDQDEAVVKCQDGSRYTADHVIVTVSLGVLKEKHQSLFYPPLPNNKETIIRKLGMDSIHQIFFQFPRRWWPVSEFIGFSFLWDEEGMDDLKRNNADKFWVKDLIGLFCVDQNPNVLEAWFSGEFIPTIESLSEEIIIEGIMFVIEKFLKDRFVDIPRPNGFIRHNWYSNPHFRGGYSHQTIKSRESSTEIGMSEPNILAEPLCTSSGKPMVLFAGEATHPIYYSVLHGAIETGFREADRIIAYYK
ncbi:hypothetical protein RI129_012973 [Pyrocoelia pectoralis]|uniref:Amine oxidase domain-containing protein n=1 Tax=Pyrocoelia pectoralis TaxID=417401 RepID=A0AAN7ZGN9_9COLE